MSKNFPETCFKYSSPTKFLTRVFFFSFPLHIFHENETVLENKLHLWINVMFFSSLIRRDVYDAKLKPTGRSFNEHTNEQVYSESEIELFILGIYSSTTSSNCPDLWTTCLLTFETKEGSLQSLSSKDCKLCKLVSPLRTCKFGGTNSGGI